MSPTELAKQIQEKKEALQEKVGLYQDLISKYTTKLTDLQSKYDQSVQQLEELRSNPQISHILSRTAKFQNTQDKFLRMEMMKVEKMLQKYQTALENFIQPQVEKAISVAMTKKAQAEEFLTKQKTSLQDAKSKLIG